MKHAQRLFMIPVVALGLALVGCEDAVDDSEGVGPAAGQTASIEPAAADATPQTAELPIKEATGEPEVVITPASNTKQLSFAVDGMHCGGCASYIQEELAALPGIAAVVVSYEKGNAIVTPTEDDAAITDDAVIAAVKELGDYHIRKAEG